MQEGNYDSKGLRARQLKYDGISTRVMNLHQVQEKYYKILLYFRPEKVVYCFVI